MLPLTVVHVSVALPRSSVATAREGFAAVSPVSWRAVEVTSGAIEASDNAAKSTSSYAYGGALYANMADAKLSAAGGTIRFTNNAASGKTETYGGAVVSGPGIRAVGLVGAVLALLAAAMVAITVRLGRKRG